MVDVEITLAETFHWSLYEIDQTDIHSLIPFFFRYARQKRRGAQAKQTYCDQVSWL